MQFDEDRLRAFARGYADAWCTHDPARVAAHEEWTLGDDGLVVESQGHYDQTEYERQLEHGAPQP